MNRIVMGLLVGLLGLSTAFAGEKRSAMIPGRILTPAQALKRIEGPGRTARTLEMKPSRKNWTKGTARVLEDGMTNIVSIKRSGHKYTITSEADTNGTSRD